MFRERLKRYATDSMRALAPGHAIGRITAMRRSSGASAPAQSRVTVGCRVAYTRATHTYDTRDPYETRAIRCVVVACADDGFLHRCRCRRHAASDQSNTKRFASAISRGRRRFPSRARTRPRWVTRSISASASPKASSASWGWPKFGPCGFRSGSRTALKLSGPDASTSSAARRAGRFTRQKQVDFSLITFVDGASLLVTDGSNIKRIADIDGKRVAVIRDTTTERALASVLANDKIKAQVIPIDSRERGIALLKDGGADAFASDRFLLFSLLKSTESAKPLRLVEEDFSVEPYALALPRNDPDFRLAVNRGLADLFRSGEINQVYARWLQQFGQPSLLLSALYVLQAIPE